MLTAAYLSIGSNLLLGTQYQDLCPVRPLYNWISRGVTLAIHLNQCPARIRGTVNNQWRYTSTHPCFHGLHTGQFNMYMSSRENVTS